MPRESKKARIARMHQEYEQLCVEIPDPKCALNFNSPFELLVATVLSAQTTDKRVNMVTPELFGEYPGPAELAAANPEHVEDIIRTIGFFRIGRLQFGEGQRRNIPAGVHHIPRYVGQNTVHRLGIIVLSCHTPLIP